ncbi:hypothetical protein [Mycobacterium sp. E1386]|uniref:hypothetical protein n=1 Tax=Mycobacterium sp. E1386 TaxID=1834126 RepID=UPI0012EA81D8|nr:hypothetical protein [Mycobacterium sp. E1386]
MIVERTTVRYVANSLALLAVCIPAIGGPGVVSADTVAPNGLASVGSWPDNACGGFSSWHVINNLKDASVRATVAVQRKSGSQEFNDRYVYDLKRGESNFVSCRRIKAPDGPGFYDISASLVGAQMT